MTGLAEEQYRIEARSLDILGGAQQGIVIGSSADRMVMSSPNYMAWQLTGKLASSSPIGYDEKTYSLRAWHFPHTSDLASRYQTTKNSDRFFVEGQESKIVAEGSKEEMLSRWDKAVHSIERLNSLDLNYPTLGVNLLRQTVNSNSAFRTFGEIMDVDIPDFPAKLEPGLDNRMLPIDVIKKKSNIGPSKASPPV